MQAQSAHHSATRAPHRGRSLAVAGAVLLALLVALPPAARATDLRLEAPAASDELRAQITAASRLLSAGPDTAKTPNALLAEGQADYARILSALYAAGHYGPVISITADGRELADLPAFEAPPKIAELVVRVSPGPRFAFGRARMGPLAPDTTLPEGFAPGAPALSGLVAQAARAGIEGWRNAGHPKAALAGQTLVADHPKARLDADLRLAPGPRLRFGPPDVTGNTQVRAARIVAIAGLPVGEVYSPKAVADAEARLRATGTFRAVRLIEGAARGTTLPLSIELADAPLRRLGVGAELASDEGLALSAFWLHRNLRGGAERLRFDGAISGIGGPTTAPDFTLSSRFERPATLRADTNFYAESTLAREEADDFREDSLRLGAGLTRRFSDTLTASAGVELSRRTVRDALGRRNFNIFGLPLEATQDRRDAPLDARSGHYANATALPFTASGDGENGLRLTGDLRIYHALGGARGTVLAGRAQLGSLIGARADSVPPGLLFFSGGSGTVRGHAFESLGVETAGGDSTGGDSTGGRSFLGLSGEARVPVWGAISAVAFVDAGHVGRSATPGQEGSWQAGAGLGLRYGTGLGPLRLDLAAPIEGDTGAGVQLYIGIGQAF